ncbi:MAG: F0F1 ATP synthase subunit B [Legionellales bacterium]|nr:F0F1 ATP synthase subunit B [Legionellales bacterium]
MSINLTLFGQMITFAIFVWFTMKYVWPPIVKAMEEREKKISDGLAAAEKAQNNLELSKKKVIEELRQAKIEANAIIENASKKATLIIDESKGLAKEESVRIINAAKVDIDQEILRAKQSLRDEVSMITVLGVEKVIKKNLDVETHKKLIDEVIQEIK